MSLLCIKKWAYAASNQNELALHQKMNFWSAWWKNTFQDFCLKALISINLAQNKYFRTHLDAFIFIVNFLPPQMIGIYQNETKLLQGIFLHWYLCCPGQPGVKWLPKQVYLNLKATWVLRCAQQRPLAAQVVPIKWMKNYKSNVFGISWIKFPVYTHEFSWLYPGTLIIQSFEMK